MTARLGTKPGGLSCLLMFFFFYFFFFFLFSCVVREGLSDKFL
ncbi:hypothetical protein SSAG_00591 [Streptomyces sp. Mg1]|nr:hypothetical protein SSAG_00591 [Streptomyces sp. Mg1]